MTPDKMVDFQAFSNSPQDNKLLDLLPFPVLLITEDASFVWLNHAAETFFDSSRTMLVGSELTLFFASDSPIFSLIDRSRSSGRSVSDSSVSFYSPKFGARRGDVNLVPIMGAKGTVSELIITIHEQTSFRQFEDMNQFKGAALSMSKMTALLSHEIKNPLAGIKGAAQLLQMELPEQSHELSEMIVTEADRITSLLNRIDTFSVDAPLSLENLNIHEVLDHTLRVTSASFGRHLVIERQYDPSLPFLDADRELLVQCFLNLFKNASEATAKGGRLKIRTSYNLARYMAQSATKRLVHLPLQIEVEDNGSGISDEVVSHIFEPFISTKTQGSGLGLAMVASIISDHGGAISLKQVPAGSCFVINLPLSDMAQKHQLLPEIDADQAQIETGDGND